MGVVIFVLGSCSTTTGGRWKSVAQEMFNGVPFAGKRTTALLFFFFFWQELGGKVT
jgi:hypothetical protein